MIYVLGYFAGFFGTLTAAVVCWVVWRARLARRYSPRRAAAPAPAAAVRFDPADETGWC